MYIIALIFGTVKHFFTIFSIFIIEKTAERIFCGRYDSVEKFISGSRSLFGDTDKESGNYGNEESEADGRSKGDGAAQGS